MFVTKRHLPRRTFLRGAGVTLALPLLESMLPAMTPLRLTAAAPVKRFVGIWHPHGAAPGYWSPVQEGRDFDFSFITKPLEPFRDRVVLILPDSTCRKPWPPTRNRAAITLAALCCCRPPRRNAVSPYLGVTIDQLIANRCGRDTILSSMQLGVEDTGNFGNCNWGYSCAYANSISWSSPTQPLPTGQPSGRVRTAVWRRHEPGRTARRPPAEREHPRLRDPRAHALRDLGAGDQTGLDTYVDNVRKLERRIRIAMTNAVKEPNGDVPFGLPESKHVHFRLMCDLMALAFEEDITRSATFMLGRDLTGTSFPESGFNGGWHGSSHRGDKPENVANYAKVNRYHVQNVAYFCDKLRNIPDGDGNLLDHVRLQGQQHGQLPSPCAREGAGDSRRRPRWHLQGQSTSGIPG